MTDDGGAQCKGWGLESIRLLSKALGGETGLGGLRSKQSRLWYLLLSLISQNLGHGISCSVLSCGHRPQHICYYS